VVSGEVSRGEEVRQFLLEMKEVMGDSERKVTVLFESDEKGNFVGGLVVDKGEWEAQTGTFKVWWEKVVKEFGIVNGKVNKAA
jgi:hypothetical protein